MVHSGPPGPAGFLTEKPVAGRSYSKRFCYLSRSAFSLANEQITNQKIIC